MIIEETIGGKHCYLYENEQASNILIQAIGTHSLEGLSEQVTAISKLAPDRPFSLVAFMVDN